MGARFSNELYTTGNNILNTSIVPHKVLVLLHILLPLRGEIEYDRIKRMTSVSPEKLTLKKAGELVILARRSFPDTRSSSPDFSDHESSSDESLNNDQERDLFRQNSVLVSQPPIKHRKLSNSSKSKPTQDKQTVENIEDSTKYNDEEADIQGHSSVKDELHKFRTFAGHEIIKRYAGEKIKAGLRVVKTDNDGGQSKETPNRLGTIKAVEISGKKVDVLWDDDDVIEACSTGRDDKFELLLFDNSLTGAKHTLPGVLCESCQANPLRGIRWKCLSCDFYNLCTVCYMKDKHDVSHIFRRIQNEDAKGVEMPPRLDIQKTGKRYAKGILPKTRVRMRGKHKKVWKVTGYCKSENDTLDLEIKRDDERIKKRINELKCKKGRTVKYYPDHLPTVGKVAFGHLEVYFKDKSMKKKIQVDIWCMTKREEKKFYTPSLFLIFANHEGYNEEDNAVLLEDVIEFSKKTMLPCYVVCQRLLFYRGSTTAVVIHYKTDYNIIKELVKRGYSNFERGEMISEDESEIDYFKRMTENVLGEKVLPVVISLRNGGFIETVLSSAEKMQFPIVQIEKTSKAVSVLTSLTFEEEESQYKATTHITTLNKPWSAKKSKSFYIQLKKENTDNLDEISTIADIPCQTELDILVCYLLIGASMASHDDADMYGKDTDMYDNALAMYLLKKGQWRIPKEFINKYFGLQSFRYIYEDNVTTDKGIWSKLRKIPCLVNVPPKWIAEERKRAGFRLYGLIFYALLQNQYYTGAKQFIETGFVRIHQILVGSAILQDVADDWRTSHFQRKTLQKLQKAFTERAIQITGCMYDERKKKEQKVTVDNTNKEKPVKELGDPVFHVGRILLNHGCLGDAIEHQNKTFMNSRTVVKILNRMWYGKPELSLKQIGYLSLLIGYAYMLLFNIGEDFSYTDYFIIGWMANFWLHETKQVLVAVVRHRFENYANDWWNRLDWVLMITFTCGMVLKFGKNSVSNDAGKIFLVVTFILLCIRILNMFSISEFVGPKLIIIQKMFKDTYAFMTIMIVIMISFNVSYYSLLYPNSELSWSEIENIMKNGFWMLIGDFDPESDILREPDCTFNKTAYTNGVLGRCPETLGVYLSPDTFAKVHEESEFYWSQLQNDFLEEYMLKTIFPVHLQIFAIPAFLLHLIGWVCFCSYNRIRGNYSKETSDGNYVGKLNASPMFVRVFIYNTNFDLLLAATKEVEQRCVMKSRGKINVMEEDKMEDLQRQIANMNRKLEKINEKTNRKNEKEEQKQVEIEDKNLGETSNKIKKTYDTKQKDQIENLNQNFRELKDETTKENVKMMKKLSQIDVSLNRIEKMIKQISPEEKFQYLDPMFENDDNDETEDATLMIPERTLPRNDTKED
ncbi:unnamed protein product [Mytilus coruscus]|uniref:ZZ-type domain-containing protein n=1 Tax=Mytilus coruscus TaxID=42192 RepID=A0A6J8BRH6_MYTCO|nr:unnamed protein product [Mytilus coruscus]